MDASETHAFETQGDGHAGAFSVPLRCRRPMRAADLTVPAPLSFPMAFLGTLVMLMLALPRLALLAPARLTPVLTPVLAPVFARIRHIPRA